jgi:hypothetical protein
MAFYKNYKSNNIENAKPGYSPNAWLLPISWIQTEGQPVGNAAPGDRFTIDDAHVPITDHGAIAVYCPPKSVEGDGEMVGETLAKRLNWKPKIIIPGDGPVVADMIEGLLNESFILFVKDAECGVSQYIQFGCVCNPCTVAAGSFKSGNAGDGRKQTEFEMEAYTKYWYNGVLTELDDDAEVDTTAE